MCVSIMPPSSLGRLPRSFIPRSNCALLGQNKKNVKVHDCTIRKSLKKHDLFGRVARGKQDMTIWLKFASEKILQDNRMEHCPLNR